MWVTGYKCESETGFTSGQRKARRQRGHWRKGIEWAIADGSAIYDLVAIEERNASVAAKQVSENDTCKKRAPPMVRLK